MKKLLILLSVLLSLLFVSIVNASDPFTTTYYSSEEFDKNLTNCSTWAVVGGNTPICSISPGHPGIAYINTGAVADAQTTFRQTALTFSTTDSYVINFVFQLLSNDSNTTVRLGASFNPDIPQPFNGAYIEKLATDTQYFCVARTFGVQTRVAMSVIPNTSYHRFTIRNINSTTIACKIDSNPEIQVSSNVHNGLETNFIHIIASNGGTNKVGAVDFADLLVSNLNR